MAPSRCHDPLLRKRRAMPFTLATWNINSVRLREPIVLKLLQEEAPDVLCLQECKSPVDKIPMEGFAALGYTHMIARGQKGYNGVAILSRMPITEVGSMDFADLGHARHIAGQLDNGVTIHNFYVPAGGDKPDREINEKFGQKLDYLTGMTGSTAKSHRNRFWSATSTSPRAKTMSGTTRNC